MIIAHRGGKPENTLEAFETCVISRVAGIEFDVWRLIDGEFVVTHDGHIDNDGRTDGHTGNHRVSELSFRQLRTINPRIPTLKEALDTIETTAINHNVEIPTLNVEMKPFQVAEELATWLRLYIERATKYTISNFVVTSFLHTEIAKFHASFPEIRVGWIMACFPMNLARTLSEYPYITVVVLSRNAVYHEYIRRLRAELISAVDIWVYCTNNSQPESVDELFSCGVSAFITDFPLAPRFKESI